MKNIFYYIIFVSAIVALFGFAFSFSEVNEPDGHQIFSDSKCTNCHSVASLELVSKKDEPVDLSNVGKDQNSEFLSKYLMKEESLNDKTHKTKFNGSEEELSALVNWLLSLGTEK